MNRAGRISYTIADVLVAGLAALRTSVLDAVIAVTEVRGHAAAIRDLERLSDRTLRDIGLHRSQIRDAVHKGEFG